MTWFSKRLTKKSSGQALTPPDSLVFENPQTAPNLESLARGVSSATNPSSLANGTTGSTASERKNTRLAQRELLYAVVRESMLHAGVLSSAYKYKVLSLDPLGRQYLIMMELTNGWAKQPRLLSEIELAIGRNAQSRHDITVTGVYWRALEPDASRTDHPGQTQGLAKEAEKLPRPRVRAGTSVQRQALDPEDFQDTEAFGPPA